MKAYVVSEPGGPEVLELKEIPDPVANSGEVLIQIKAFGLNRAEAITRMGGSFDSVKFPKVLGIECVGTVLSCPSGELSEGQTVAAAMVGMGRLFDGSYAEKTVVPLSHVFPLTTTLDWVTLGSIPETYFTARGSVIEALKLDQVSNPKVLVRPGASALGIAITQIINRMGGEVIGVTRSSHKKQRLLDAGMKEVIVSGESIAKELLEIWPDGVDGIVDGILSEMTVKDNLEVKKKEGGICMIGSLAESYSSSKHADYGNLMKDPTATFFSSDEVRREKDTIHLQQMVEWMEQGEYKPNIAQVFDFSELVQAHGQMDKNAFAGKVVVRL